MKAVMLKEPKVMELVNLPDEKPGLGEVVLRVEACSICGSDLEGYHGHHPKMTLPRVMGHEVACTIEDVGPGVTEFSIGDRVAGTGLKACRSCLSCKEGRPDRCEQPLEPGFTAHGAYAERMVVLPRRLMSIPEDISFEEAAVAQPVCIANHAVATRAEVKEGETVLVQGCGPIGLAALVLSKLRGATVVATDIVDYRCQWAGKFGADLFLNAHTNDILSVVRDLTDGEGVDKVIECVGGDQDDTLLSAVRAVRRGGLVVMVGSFSTDCATLPVVDFKFNEKQLIGSQGMPEGYAPIFDLIRSDMFDIKSLVTHRFPLEETPHALRLMDKKADEVMKVVLFSRLDTDY